MIRLTNFLSLSFRLFYPSAACSITGISQANSIVMLRCRTRVVKYKQRIAFLAFSWLQNPAKESYVKWCKRIRYTYFGDANLSAKTFGTMGGLLKREKTSELSNFWSRWKLDIAAHGMTSFHLLLFAVKDFLEFSEKLNKNCVRWSGSVANALLIQKNLL